MIDSLSVQEVIDFLTSRSGVFAAIVAVVGLIGATWKLVTSFIGRQAKIKSDRQASIRADAGLKFADIQLSELSRSSNMYELQFVITNSSSMQLIMRRLILQVVGRSPCMEAFLQATPRLR